MTEKCSPEEGGVRNGVNSVILRVSLKCDLERRLGRGEERVLLTEDTGRAKALRGASLVWEGAALRPGCLD